MSRVCYSWRKRRLPSTRLYSYEDSVLNDFRPRIDIPYYPPWFPNVFTHFQSCEFHDPFDESYLQLLLQRNLAISSQFFIRFQDLSRPIFTCFLLILKYFQYFSYFFLKKFFLFLKFLVKHFMANNCIRLLRQEGGNTPPHTCLCV